MSIFIISELEKMAEQQPITKTKEAVGVLIVCRQTNNIFLLQRSKLAGRSHQWALLSGGLEEGENPLEALGREVREEISVNPSTIDFYNIGKEVTTRNNFYYYVGFTNQEFIPKLNEENEDWGWFSLDENDTEYPYYLSTAQPMMHELEVKIEQIKNKFSNGTNKSTR